MLSKMKLKKRGLAMRLSLATALLLAAGGHAFAKDADTSFFNKPIDPAHGQTYNQRQKMQHSERKAAAARLKVKFQEAHVRDIARQINEHLQRNNGNKGKSGRNGGAQ